MGDGGMVDDERVKLTGYFPGAIGKVVELHGTYYARHWGFDLSFESQVGRELSEFMSSLDPQRDGFWAATDDGRFAGSIVIDGHSNRDQGARLRWFIVDTDFQGRGIGRRLMEEALSFCGRVGHRKVYLWTFKGLEAARALYEDHGFRLAEEQAIAKWGGTILEQKFSLDLPL